MPGAEPPKWGSAAWHDYLIRQMDSLRSRDPVADAKSAVARRDFHLLALSGYALNVPGLEREWPKYPHQIYVFRATSDALEGEDHMRYTGIAYDYAKAYNAYVLGQLPRNGH